MFGKSLSKARYDRPSAPAARLRPYGQPGRMPKTAGAQLATSVALLIELEAQFYKLVTINQCLAAYACEMVNKSSKSNLCYIDSDPL